MNSEMIEKILKEMSIEDLCGQLLNYNIPANKTDEELHEMFRNTRPGGLFFGWNTTPERIAQVTAIAEQYTKVPVIVPFPFPEKPRFM